MYYVAFWTGYYRELGRWAGITTGFTYLFTPFFYYYISRGYLFHRGHLIPFILYFSLYTVEPYLGIKPTPISNFISNFIQCAHVIVYGIMMWKTIYHTAHANKLHRFIAFSFNGYALSFLIYYLLVWTGYWTLAYDYIISFASSIMIYGIGYIAFMDSHALQDRSKKYKRSTLTSDSRKAIFLRLEEHMQKNKPYLDSELKLGNLAEQLGYSSNQLSEVINHETNKNFSDLINEYRIREAVNMINETNEKPIFIHVAMDSGFNNKVSFSNAFKKFMHCTPTDYYLSRKEKVTL